jgi:glycoside/pentoside/hexuronide:cation symporter, GPH family
MKIQFVSTKRQEGGARSAAPSSQDEASVDRANLTVPPANRIPFKEKVGYSLGDSASNLYWKTFEFFLAIFYTDVFGIPAAAVGNMLLVTRLGDAGADLLMGSIADRTRTRWGYFRPYLLWSALPLAVAGVLTFTTPRLGNGPKLLYAYITYGALMLIYTAVNTPYSALMGVMTPNSVERTSISSIRFVGAFITGLFVQYFTLGFVNFFGRGSDARGWQLTMVLYGALAIVLLLLCFISTHERVIPSAHTHGNAASEWELAGLLRSWPWLILVGTQILTVSAFTIEGSASTYYFKYFVKRQDLLGLFLAANGVAYLAAVLITSQLARQVGKRFLFILSLVLGGLVVAFFSMARPSDIGFVFGLQIVSSFMFGFKSPLVFAMFADEADHTEWRSGKRITGLVLGSAIFSTKIGMAIGGWLVGLILAQYGYVANASQTSRSLHGIVLSMSWIPCAMVLSAAAAMTFYPLDDAFMSKIERDLALRKEEAGR